MSTMSVSTPNHSQVSRIRYGIQALQNGQDTPDWRGNSYAGIVGYPGAEGERLYTLIHWNTEICQLIIKDGVARVVYFDARYISSTTRSFQGRILNALRTALGENDPMVVMIQHELGRKTHMRGVLIHDDATV